MKAVLVNPYIMKRKNYGAYKKKRKVEDFVTVVDDNTPETKLDKKEVKHADLTRGGHPAEIRIYDETGAWSPRLSNLINAGMATIKDSEKEEQKEEPKEEPIEVSIDIPDRGKGKRVRSPVAIWRAQPKEESKLEKVVDAESILADMLEQVRKETKSEEDISNVLSAAKQAMAKPSEEVIAEINANTEPIQDTGEFKGIDKKPKLGGKIKGKKRQKKKSSDYEVESGD
jgi:hypothetical protein